MKLYLNTILIFSFLFWGALGRIFKGCSKADDVAHAGSYVKNLDHIPYQTNYKTMGRYLTSEAVIKDPILFKRNLEVTEIIDNKVINDLKMKDPSIKSQIDYIDEKFLPSERIAEYQKIIEKHAKNINFQDYKKLFKMVKLASKMKKFYTLDGNVKDDNKELPENYTYSKNGFYVHIPKGFYEITSLQNPIIDKIWMSDNAMITVYSFEKNDKKSLEEWKNFKGENRKILQLFESEERLINHSVFFEGEKIYGLLKILKEGNKILFVEVSFDDHLSYIDNRKDLLSKI
ncbi:hypothetical protein [Chryseobacterium polytrichastri]|uniref:Uncharacterized protein n=1 Tax=Chryseobacterium polytrichastri TaxID=1302687 RepID=A0A1M7B046_9FLAO|nr:hypothetical protein [Chryseobacterium polytrichastri]SHL48378.1 hypothetical protein SAMN05444267_101897 [Chryseobacterium polytrichastri]